MVATIDAERTATTTSTNDKVWKAISVFSAVGALAALIWLGVVTSNLNDTRAKLDRIAPTANSAQMQFNDPSQRVRGREAYQNTNPMQQAAPNTAADPMPWMPSLGYQQAQPSVDAGTMPNQPQTGRHGMGGM